MADSAQAPISHRQYVSYIDKSREYYAAHGYTKPYMWARHDEVPFTKPAKPLAEMRVGVVTTSHPWNDDHPRGKPAGGKQVCAVDASVQPERMFTDDLSWDKLNNRTDDVGAFLPLDHLRVLVDEGVIGSVSGRYYSIPTEYSQRRTRDHDAPAVVGWAAEDDVDLMVLVPL